METTNDETPRPDPPPFATVLLSRPRADLDPAARLGSVLNAPLVGSARFWRIAVDPSTRYLEPLGLCVPAICGSSQGAGLGASERGRRAMDLGIKGRKAIVNGGSAGMGRSAALWLAQLLQLRS